ncbi:MAG: ATP synthase F0 subunit C [Oscillospiraceae bacterium]|jgi:F-type H+-transporting ATPase subunit c|nr:ATP synthase F0 subunit C [Oscillospiraceae bacterium]
MSPDINAFAEALASVLAAGQIGAGIAILATFFTAIGQGNIVAKTIESTARQPEAAGAIRPTMFIGLAMAETGGIYGLVIAFVMLFVNPLGTWFFNQLASKFGL